MIATLLIIISVTLAVITGPKDSCDYTVVELMERYTFTPFLIFAGSLIGITIIDYIICKIFESRNFNDGIEMDGTFAPRYSLFLCLSYTCIGATAGAFNVLFTKSFFGILPYIDEEYKSYGTYLVLLG
eukprot:UN32690